MEDGLDDQEAEIASGTGGSAPGSVVAMLRFQATLRSDRRRRVYLPLPGEPEVRDLAGTWAEGDIAARSSRSTGRRRSCSAPPGVETAA